MSKADFNGSNLVKAYRLQRDSDEPVIIDSNNLIQEKLERLRMIMPVIGQNDDSEYEESAPGEFTDGLDALMLDALTDENYETEYDEDGNPVSNVIKASAEDFTEYEAPMAEPVEQYSGPSPEELIAEAEAQIEQMRQEAMLQIDKDREAAYNEGRSLGYSDGKAQAEAEIGVAWQELEEARGNLNAEREALIAELEPQFVHTLTSIYEKVFEVDLRDEKELVVNLLRNAMLHIESTKNYLIHVSREDHEYVVENRDSLITSSMPADVTIDIIEDVTMKQGDCMIETSGGIFDCGLGTQLETLKKKLELLSYNAQ